MTEPQEPIDSPSAEDQAQDDLPPEPGTEPDDRDLPEDNTADGDPEAPGETEEDDEA